MRIAVKTDNESLTSIKKSRLPLVRLCSKARTDHLITSENGADQAWN